METTPRSRGRHPKHPVLHLGGNQPHMGRIHIHSGLNKGPRPLIPPGPPGPLIPPGPPGPLIPPGPPGPLIPPRPPEPPIPPGPLTLITSFAPKKFGPLNLHPVYQNLCPGNSVVDHWFGQPTVIFRTGPVSNVTGLFGAAAARSAQVCHREKRSDEAIPDGQTVRGAFLYAAGRQRTGIALSIAECCAIASRDLGSQ